MKFNLIINATEAWDSSSTQALRLCQTILADGHELGMVFFFGHSVKIVNSAQLLHSWQQWQQASQIKLFLCSAMVHQHQVTLPGTEIEGFKVVGLASWIDAIEQADRIIELN